MKDILPFAQGLLLFLRIDAYETVNKKLPTLLL